MGVDCVPSHNRCCVDGGSLMALYGLNRGRRRSRGKKKLILRKTIKDKHVSHRKHSSIRVQIDMDELELPRDDFVSILNMENKANLKEFTISMSPQHGHWKDGNYTFKFVLPEFYPYRPPQVVCMDTISHPNIDNNGNICLSVLKGGWKPTMSVQTVVHCLMLLLLEPPNKGD